MDRVVREAGEGGAGRQLQRELACSPALREQIASAMAVHGPFTSFESFADLVLSIAEERGRSERDMQLAQLMPAHLADLHLARACAHSPHHEQAWKVLLAKERKELLACAYRLKARAAEQEVDDFLSDLWLPRPCGSNLLSTYLGRAPLSAWLSLVFRRRWFRLSKAASGAAPATSTGEQVQASPCPLELAARMELGWALRDDLSQALAGLRPRDREFVVARLLGEEQGTVLALRHGVSPSFVSHRTSKLVEQLRLRVAPLLGRFGIRAEYLQ